MNYDYDFRDLQRGFEADPANRELAGRFAVSEYINRAINFYDPPAPIDCVQTIPSALSDICQRALNKDPPERYQSLAELIQAIDQATVANI